ncbi:hypothetical protein WJX72_008022 [[Myrmecia] bisecta]|uniref:Peptidase M50 domain-containing protein n=1 Tax=[Myrmecia] bisecta TaxID=41462 RepID=A0AAW1Q567_9CHLO
MAEPGSAQLLHSPGTVPLGSIFGIPIRLHMLFGAAVILAVLGQVQNSWHHVLWALLMFGPILLLTVLIHELGHCWATRKVGAPVHGILLWPLGGLAFVGHTSGPKSDIFVAVMGPLTHLPQMLIWFIMYIPSYHATYGDYKFHFAIEDPQFDFWLSVVSGALQLNLFLMAFNLLLPAYPLDGGRIFADLLLLCGLGEVLAAQITIAVAVLVAAGILAWGIYEQAILTVAVGAWMLYTTYELFSAVRKGSVTRHPMFCYDAQPGQAEQPQNPILPPNQQYSARV